MNENNVVTVRIMGGKPIGYLTVPEYANRIFLKEVTVRQYIRRGKIPFLKIGDTVWIREDTLRPVDKRTKAYRNSVQACS